MFASLLSHLLQHIYILSIRPSLLSGDGRFGIHGGETPIDTLAIIGTKCFENKKNASLLSEKRVQK